MCSAPRSVVVKRPLSIPRSAIHSLAHAATAQSVRTRCRALVCGPSRLRAELDGSKTRKRWRAKVRSKTCFSVFCPRGRYSLSFEHMAVSRVRARALHATKVRAPVSTGGVCVRNRICGCACVYGFSGIPCNLVSYSCIVWDRETRVITITITTLAPHAPCAQHSRLPDASPRPVHPLTRQ